MFKLARTLLLGGVIGKVTGVLRELIAAWLFGTGPIAAAYRVAQSGFLIPLQGLASEALSSGFTPAYARRLARSKEDASSFFASIAVVFVSIALAVGALLFVFAAKWIRILAPTFEPYTFELSVSMVRILAVCLPFYVFVSLIVSADMVAGGGKLAATRSSAQSLGLILGTILAWWLKRPELIAVGFVLAYITLCILGLNSMKDKGLLGFPARFGMFSVREDSLEIWRSFRWLIVLPLVMQVHFVVERRVATYFGESTIVALDYARFIIDTSVLLLAMPFGLAGLASMATMSQEEFESSAARSLGILCHLGVVISTVLNLFSDEIVSILFGYGAFKGSSTDLTATILSGLAIGLTFQLLSYPTAKYLIARGKVWDALVAGLIGAIINIVVNLYFYRSLGIGVLSVSTALAGAGSAAYALVRLQLLKRMKAQLVAACGYAVVVVLVDRFLFRGNFKIIEYLVVFVVSALYLLKTDEGARLAKRIKIMK